jgi:hypothetical protein
VEVKGDHVFSESENSSESKSESEDNAEGSEVESLDSSNSNDTVPTAPKTTKEEGWKWIVTGDKPSKFHFTRKSAIIQNLPPEPNP